jgi:glycosyltransferase involved in cell wall biosynthesis
MKIIFFQQKRELYYSVHILFNIIRQHLPESIKSKVLYFSPNGLTTLKKIKNLRSVSTQEESDINHIVEEVNYAALFMSREKTILTIHDVMRFYDSKGLQKFIFLWLWLKLPIARAGVVTAVSHTTRNEILKYVNCPPDKIRVIYNCISPAYRPVAKLFNKEKPVLLQVGVKASKNLNRVIQAIEGISCKLAIVGKPSPATIALLKKHNIDFTWKVDLSAAEMIQQYIDCDVLVFASLYEGFGVPIVEANTVERVVVTSNCSAMAEVAGSAACLVDPLDIASIRAGILKVINEDAYRDQLIEAGRINRKRFDVQTITDQYVQLYEEIYVKNNKRKKAVEPASV